MAYYGPKTVSAKGDTVYYSVSDDRFGWGNVVCDSGNFVDMDGKFWRGISADPDSSSNIDTTKFPVYIILFIHDSLKNEGYKLNGIYDYVQYKPNELKDIPIFFVYDYFSIKQDSAHVSIKQRGTFDSLKINLPNFYPLWINVNYGCNLYFKGKPYYVFNYFAVLVDKHRHIRGYYDPNQNSEVKRMVQEYKHLKTKDEYANTLKQNDLKQK
jgi:hypothetical protein